MLPVLCLAGILVASAATSFAQANAVGLYSNPNATDCNLYDVPGLHEVHVVYNGELPISGSEFQVIQTHGASLTYLGDTVPDLSYLSNGSAPTGIAVVWGEYRPAPIHVLTIFYYGQGGSSICGRLELGNDPRSRHVNPGHILTLTPIHVITWVDALDMNVNPSDECLCDVAGSPTPTESTTWGHVKSLYGMGVE